MDATCSHLVRPSVTQHPFVFEILGAGVMVPGEGDQLPSREIKRVRPRDIALVTYPADVGTSVSASVLVALPKPDYGALRLPLDMDLCE